MAWFQREVLFLEAESGKIIEETFDSLIKSDLAVNSLKTLKKKKLREVIGKKYMRKIDCVIFKFSKEIDAADELFENKKDRPWMDRLVEVMANPSTKVRDKFI